jgi:hypothetical protein
MPIGGSINPYDSTIALSNRPISWPLSWTAWKGLYVEGEAVGDLEAYFEMDDQNDKRMFLHFGFLPVPSDPFLYGQGIRVTVRYVQLDHPKLRDVLFRVVDIFNESSYDYAKVVFGGLTGTYVGVSYDDNTPQEYDDDAVVLFRSDEMILVWDYPDDNSRNHLWQGQVGRFGEAFVDAPNGGHIGSYFFFAPSMNIPLGDDESLWQRLVPGSYTGPGSTYSDTTVTNGSDGDYTYGTDLFSLGKGERRRIASVLAYGYTRDDILLKIRDAKTVYAAHFNTSVLSVSEDGSQVPKEYNLAQNYPNPFNPSTTIKYELPTPSMVKLSVYDMLGREVSVLVNERKNAGSYEVKFDAAGLASGVYFCRLQAGDFVQSRKLLLLR